MVQHDTQCRPGKGNGHPLDPFSSFDHSGVPPSDYFPSQQQQHRSARARPEKQCESPIEQEGSYVAIVLSKNGRMHLRSSPNLKDFRQHILSSAVDKFNEYTSRTENLKREAARNAQQTQLESLSTQGPAQDRPFGCISNSISNRSHKRPRADTDTDGTALSSYDRSRPSRLPTSPNGQRKTKQIEVGNTQEAELWISEAFEAVQQVGCRLVAKLWIKKIHPKKQSTNPYNGGFPKDNPIKDPERTKPPYWPAEVEHKEPDHIQKQQRIILLTHLIMNTPYMQLVPRGKHAEEIDAAALQEQTEERKNDINNEKWEILKDIFKLRTMMEAHARGEYDGTMNVNVIDCGKSTRLEQGESENDIADDDDSVPTVVDDCTEEDDEEPEAVHDAGMMTPESSDVQSPTDRSHSQQLVHGGTNNSSFSYDAADNMDLVQASARRDRIFEDNFPHVGSSHAPNSHSRSMNQDHGGYGRSDRNLTSVNAAQYQQQHLHRQRWALQTSQASNSFNPPTDTSAQGHHPDAVLNAIAFDDDMFDGAQLGGLPHIPQPMSNDNIYHHHMQQALHQRQMVGFATGIPQHQPNNRRIPFRNPASEQQQIMPSRQDSYDHTMMNTTYYPQM